MITRMNAVINDDYSDLANSQLILTVGSLIFNYYEVQDTEDEQLIEILNAFEEKYVHFHLFFFSLSHYSFRAKEGKNERERILYIRALGNAQQSRSYQLIHDVLMNEKESNEVQTAAIRAFSKIRSISEGSERDEANDLFFHIFTSKDRDNRLRIESLKYIISDDKAASELLTRIIDILSEEENYYIADFIVSSLKSAAK